MTTASTNERSDFSRFGKSFQESLVQLILMDRPFCDQIREVFSIEFLELKYLQAFVQIVFSYKDKYKIHPTFDIMTTLIRSGLDDQNETVQKQVRAVQVIASVLVASTPAVPAYTYNPSP